MTTDAVILHASRNENYRKPFGARPTSSMVSLCLENNIRDVKAVTLCYSYGLYEFGYYEQLMDATNDGDRVFYNAEILLPNERGIFFYWFKFYVPCDVADEIAPEFKGSLRKPEHGGIYRDYYTLYYVAEGMTQDGSGRIYFEPPRIGVDENKYPLAWQITVYDKNFKTPDYMKGSVMYQVFPDRFARDVDFTLERMENAELITANNPRNERVYHEDWYEDVDIYGKPETGYLACDFFGGSLPGIIEKLDYIKSLGINVLYLNPIFEARSSHRYDTADYLSVDPILRGNGGNEVFEELCKKANALGIKIIIDGVFSHTGADSRYFNKFDRYDGVGAYKAYVEGTTSKYRSWYSFIPSNDGQVKYHAWWGFPDLPNVNENDLAYRQFIFGDKGVVRTWLRRGASGIRLDVSDELPDSFIRQMRDTVKEETKGEGIVIGEVWEDASNKCSYGTYRDFMLGTSHDSVMGYTFREGVIAFLKGHMNAQGINAYLEGFRERYPLESYYCIMNLISSHDVPRAITVLAGEDDPGDREKQKAIKLSDDALIYGARMMRLALAFQMMYIGAPCIYYGDEILMEGYRDPFNRRTYPWGRLTSIMEEQLSFTKTIANLRQEHPVIRTGDYRTILATENVLCFERFLIDVDNMSFDVFGKPVNKGSKKIQIIINNNSDNVCYNIKDAKLVSDSTNANMLGDTYIVKLADYSTDEFIIEAKSFAIFIY